jgi:uncharacterized RDD family membrane protein YckC
MDTRAVTSSTVLSDVSQTRILTGEAVHLDVRVARVGSRALARAIDAFCQVVTMIVMFLGLIVVASFLALANVVKMDGAVPGVILIISIVVAMVGYPVLFETWTRGRTPGKMIMGLRAVRDDGGPITFRHAFARGMVGLAIEWPGMLGAPLTWLVTIWTMIASPQSKRLGDHVAGTIVIHERTPAAWGWVPQMPPELAQWAATLDLAALDDDLALAVRHFLARNRGIREPARSELGKRLAHEVASVTNPPVPAGTPGWKYLAAVHAERHRRAMRQLAAVRSRAATVWPDLAAATAAPSVAVTPPPLPAMPTPLPAAYPAPGTPVAPRPRTYREP